MHLAVKKRKREGWSDQELEKINDLDSWCDQLDNKYLEMEEKDERIPANIKEIWKDVPCHADFYRYVQVRFVSLEKSQPLATLTVNTFSPCFCSSSSGTTGPWR